MRFSLEGFNSLIFAETFLYDIHYSENLSGKIVVQANGFVGDTAIYYASKGAICYSFEPDPNSFKIAKLNISLNSELSHRIFMFNYAIGKDGMIDFPVNECGSAVSSTFQIAGKKTIKVRSVSINTILEELKIENPYLLGLDIKGNEFDVVNDDAISKFQKVRIEYTPELVGYKEEGRNFLIDKLKSKGFNVVRIFKHNPEQYDLHFHDTLEAVKK